MSAAVRRKQRRKTSPANYREKDHNVLNLICSRHLTIREWRRLERHRLFKDWADLMAASVHYFGVTVLGWPVSGVGMSMGRSRNTLKDWVDRIEDVRVNGDVFERIEAAVEAYKNGLI